MSKEPFVKFIVDSSAADSYLRSLFNLRVGRRIIDTKLKLSG